MLKIKNMPQPKSNNFLDIIQYIREVNKWSGDFLAKYDDFTEFVEIEPDYVTVTEETRQITPDTTTPSADKPMILPHYSKEFTRKQKAWHIIHDLGGSGTVDEVTDRGMELEPDEDRNTFRTSMANQLSILKKEGWLDAISISGGAYRYIVKK